MKPSRADIFVTLMRSGFPSYRGGNSEEEKKQWAIVDKQTDALINLFEEKAMYELDGKGGLKWN